MTPCPRYPDDDLVMRYVIGDVAEPELSTFEDHLFACDTCLARVERYQAAQQSLAVKDLPVVPAIVHALDGPAAGGPRLPWWIVGSMAAAVVLGLATLFLWRAPAAGDAARVARRPEPPGERAAGVAATRGPAAAELPPAPTAAGRTSAGLQVAVLAMVTPPPYLAMVTRGAGDVSERFAEGMDAYTRADWSTASRVLRGIDTPQARFHAGIADLMRGENAAAVEVLEATRASGRAPYARESVFYLGKAALQRGDVDKAREWFTAARQAGAGPAGEAARLLAELAEISTQTPVTQGRPSDAGRRQ